MTLALLMIGGAAIVSADNCCNLGWQCHTNDDWVAGFHAHRQNLCGQPAQPQPAQHANGAAAGADNCCFVNQQCQTGRDFIVGWEAYKFGHCETSVTGSIKVEGPPEYVADTRMGLQWLLTHAPKWHKYVTDVIRVIRVGKNVGASVHQRHGRVTTQH